MVLQDTPTKVILTDDDLRCRLGFQNIHNVTKYIHKFALNTFSHTKNNSPDIIDLGEIATIDKSKRNTIPLRLPQSFVDVIHCDILYGSQTAIKEFRYAMFLIMIEQLVINLYMV